MEVNRMNDFLMNKWVHGWMNEWTTIKGKIDWGRNLSVKEQIIKARTNVHVFICLNIDLNKPTQKDTVGKNQDTGWIVTGT